MKKTAFLSLIAFLLFALACNGKDNIISYEQLPENAKKFISTHFPKNNVQHVERDSDLFDKDYDVSLNNGVNIDFDKDGNWESVEWHEQLPTSVVNLLPQTARDYINKNYQNSQITKIDNAIGENDNKWEIELKTKNLAFVELEFNKNGDLIKVDNN